MSDAKIPLVSLEYPTVLPGDADKAIAVLEELDDSEPLWYLAYGSNLNSGVFKGRRGIRPLEEHNVLVEGLELTFDLPGIPYMEPRFANCRFASTHPVDASFDGSEKRREHELDLNDRPWTGKGALIGVAYFITPEDFARVIATEGGGSGYKMVSVEGKVFETKRKLGQKSARVEFTGKVVHAYTLLAPIEKTRKSPGQPSSRYLSLIQNGAEEHALPPSYREYLSELIPYTPTTLRQKAGRALSLAVWVPPMLVLLLLGAALSRADGSYPQWVTDASDRLRNSVWSTYDGAMRGRFGDGERTIGTEDGA